MCSSDLGYHLIWHLAQTGVLCWGREVNGQQMLVLLSEWVREPRILPRDEALGEFVLRYLMGHGPATVADFAWWAKLTLADARRGVAVAASELTELSVGDEIYLAAASTDTGDSLPRYRQRMPVMALGPFDEYLLGYQDRFLVVSPEEYLKVVPGKNGLFLPLIVIGGRVVGTWRKPPGRRGSITVSAEPFTQLSPREAVSFERAVTAYGRFFGRNVDVITGRDSLKS